MTSGGEETCRNRHNYRPTLEAVEALRLLSSASVGALFPGLAAEHSPLVDPGPAGLEPVDDSITGSNATKDSALVQTQLNHHRL